MHRMHRIFSGDGWLVFPDILKSAHDHCPSQPLLQQPPVLIILCILCIDVPFIPKFPPFYTWKIVLSHLFSYRKGLRCEILCSHVYECYLS